MTVFFLNRRGGRPGGFGDRRSDMRGGRDDYDRDRSRERDRDRDRRRSGGYDRGGYVHDCDICLYESFIRKSVVSSLYENVCILAVI